MTKLENASAANTVPIQRLTFYLCDNRISHQLGQQLHMAAINVQSLQRRMADESTIPILALVSDTLREQLHAELYSPTLMQHPFFESPAGESY